jgi:hypothetical protein
MIDTMDTVIGVACMGVALFQYAKANATNCNEDRSWFMQRGLFFLIIGVWIFP